MLTIIPGYAVHGHQYLSRILRTSWQQVSWLVISDMILLTHKIKGIFCFRYTLKKILATAENWQKDFTPFFARLPYARCIKLYWPNPPTGGNYMLLISLNDVVHIANRIQNLILRFMLREILIRFSAIHLDLFVHI